MRSRVVRTEALSSLRPLVPGAVGVSHERRVRDGLPRPRRDHSDARRGDRGAHRGAPRGRQPVVDPQRRAAGEAPARGVARAHRRDPRCRRHRAHLHGQRHRGREPRDQGTLVEPAGADRRPGREPARASSSPPESTTPRSTPSSGSPPTRAPIVEEVPVDEVGRVRLDALEAALAPMRHPSRSSRCSGRTTRSAPSSPSRRSPAWRHAPACRCTSTRSPPTASCRSTCTACAGRRMPRAGAGLVALSVSAHKIGGPAGIGALVLDRSAAVEPLIHGGGQQRKVRSGTQDVAAAASFAAAAEAVHARLDARRRADVGAPRPARRGCARRGARRAALAATPTPPADCPETCTSPSPAARAIRCSSSSTRPASPCRPARRARRACQSRRTCSWRWAARRPTRAGRCASPSATSRPTPMSMRSWRRLPRCPRTGGEGRARRPGDVVRPLSASRVATRATLRSRLAFCRRFRQTRGRSIRVHRVVAPPRYDQKCRKTSARGIRSATLAYTGRVKVLAAMSGGVDSAVAAARAVEAGHDVVGVHLALSRMPGTLRTGSRGCCTIEDSMDAQRAANVLGIPYYVWDFSERFKADVVDDFVAEYTAGRTPNPCMRCNERIKFAALLEKALALGFDAVATGHYAKIVTDAAGNRELHRASAEAKDQCVRARRPDRRPARPRVLPARRHALEAARARRGGPPRACPSRRSPTPTTSASSPTATRRGGSPIASAPRRARSSTGREPSSARTRARTPTPSASAAGSASACPRPTDVRGSCSRCGRRRTPSSWARRRRSRSPRSRAPRFTWAGLPPADASTPFACEVQIRAHADPVPAVAVVADGELVVTPGHPLDGVAPGQTAVVYVGTRVLGQCTIDRTVSAVPVGLIRRWRPCRAAAASARRCSDRVRGTSSGSRPRRSDRFRVDSLALPPAPSK